jgi:L-fucose mutarotase
VLKSRLIHPAILQALAEAGHGSQILIADGNYPLATGSAATARRVHLNLAPGIVSVTDVLEVVCTAIPVEAASVMRPADDGEPAIYPEFRALLPELELERLGRFDFYERARGRDLALAIATGDIRLYANILLTIGVVDSEQRP